MITEPDVSVHPYAFNNSVELFFLILALVKLEPAKINLSKFKSKLLYKYKPNSCVEINI